MEKKKAQQLQLGFGKRGGGPSSPKKLKLATEVAAAEASAHAKETGSFSPMVSISTVDSRPLLCHKPYDKWTFPGNMY